MRKFGFGGFIAGVLMTASTAMADVSEGIAALEAGNVQGAAQLFQEAFDAGEADGAFYLGRLFELGLGTDKDMRRAAALYAVAAEAAAFGCGTRLFATAAVFTVPFAGRPVG